MASSGASSMSAPSGLLPSTSGPLTQEVEPEAGALSETSTSSTNFSISAAVAQALSGFGAVLSGPLQAEITRRTEESIRGAVQQRDDLSTQLEVAEAELQSFKERSEAIKAAAHGWEVAFFRQFDAIKQLQEEVSRWRDNSTNWHKHYVRAEEERRELKSKLSNLEGEQAAAPSTSRAGQLQFGALPENAMLAQPQGQGPQATLQFQQTINAGMQFQDFLSSYSTQPEVVGQPSDLQPQPATSSSPIHSEEAPPIANPPQEAEVIPPAGPSTSDESPQPIEEEAPVAASPDNTPTSGEAAELIAGAPIPVPEASGSGNADQVPQAPPDEFSNLSAPPSPMTEDGSESSFHASVTPVSESVANIGRNSGRGPGPQRTSTIPLTIPTKESRAYDVKLYGEELPLEDVVQDLGLTLSMEDFTRSQGRFSCPYAGCSWFFDGHDRRGRMARHLESEAHGTHYYVCMDRRCLQKFTLRTSLRVHHKRYATHKAAHARALDAGLWCRVRKEDLDKFKADFPGDLT